MADTLHGRFQRLLARARGAGFDPMEEFHQMDMTSMMVLIAERLGTKGEFSPDDVLALSVPLESILR